MKRKLLMSIAISGLVVGCGSPTVSAHSQQRFKTIWTNAHSNGQGLTIIEDTKTHAEYLELINRYGASITPLIRQPNSTVPYQ